jgi:hypothetical protein
MFCFCAPKRERAQQGFDFVGVRLAMGSRGALPAQLADARPRSIHPRRVDSVIDPTNLPSLARAERPSVSRKKLTFKSCVRVHKVGYRHLVAIRLALALMLMI